MWRWSLLGAHWAAWSSHPEPGGGSTAHSPGCAHQRQLASAQHCRPGVRCRPTRLRLSDPGPCQEQLRGVEACSASCEGKGENRLPRAGRTVEEAVGRWPVLRSRLFLQRERLLLWAPSPRSFLLSVVSALAGGSCRSSVNWGLKSCRLRSLSLSCCGGWPQVSILRHQPPEPLGSQLVRPLGHTFIMWPRDKFEFLPVFAGLRMGTGTA